MPYVLANVDLSPMFSWAKGEELSILQNITFYFGEPTWFLFE